MHGRVGHEFRAWQCIGIRFHRCRLDQPEENAAAAFFALFQPILALLLETSISMNRNILTLAFGEGIRPIAAPEDFEVVEVAGAMAVGLGSGWDGEVFGINWCDRAAEIVQTDADLMD